MKIRFKREDWLDFGLQRLADAGPEALKLHPLCEAAQRTIGSFYHHFEDHGAFINALMDHWRQEFTLGIVDQLDGLEDGNAQADKLNRLAIGLDRAIEVGVRHLASQNARAAEEVSKVDALRMDYVTQMYAERFNLAADEARSLSQLEYAAFVGTQTIWPKEKPELAEKLASLFHRLVLTTYQE